MVILLEPGKDHCLLIEVKRCAMAISMTLMCFSSFYPVRKTQAFELTCYCRIN